MACPRRVRSPMFSHLDTLTTHSAAASAGAHRVVHEQPRPEPTVPRPGRSSSASVDGMEGIDATGSSKSVKRDRASFPASLETYD